MIRENYLSTKHLRAIVLDEADTLLNFGDNPEVEWLLDGMPNDYQLVLASATINKRVEKFVGEVMELEVGEEGYVVVGGGDSFDNGGLFIDDGISMDREQNKNTNPDVDIEGEFDSEPNGSNQSSTPVVRHWSMPASPTSRIALTSDLIITLTPRRGIVFVPTKAEVESVSQELAERLTAKDVSVHILHGDMVQQARSRTMNAFRDDSTRITRILIATDVAARGLDLPAVDLVLQYGVPRKTGKDGTYDSELYIHRTGRAGRFGNTRSADAIRAFHAEHQDIILKPLDGMGGMGIFRVGPDGLNLGSISETLNKGGAQTVMVQKYLPEIVAGDKRILVIGGVPVPFALARIPQGSEIRGNLAVGGKGVAMPLTPREREIATALGPTLAARGLLLVGLDVIGDCLTEINVTSPTCFQEITDQTGFDVPAMFINALEKAIQP